MVENAKKKSIRSSRYLPTPGIEASNACSATLKPAIEPLIPSPKGNMSLWIKMAIAVSVQTSPESIDGPIIATRPSLTGSLFLDAPCIIDAVPTPASLTNAARLIPISAIEASAPIPPPTPALTVSASVKIDAKTPGTASRSIRKYPTYRI